MNSSDSGGGSEAKKSFRIHFERVMAEVGVPEPARKWYFSHLKAWGDFCRREGLGEGYPVLLERYLTDKSVRTVLKGWQIGQIIEAIRLAHEKVMEEGWARDLDWEELVERLIIADGTRRRSHDDDLYACGKSEGSALGEPFG